MVNRIAMNADGIVVSVPGKDALSPLLNPDDKIFDSNWAFSSFILHEGNFLHSNSDMNDVRFVTQTTINFPDVGSIPYVQILATSDQGTDVLQTGLTPLTFGITKNNVQTSRVKSLYVHSDKFIINWEFTSAIPLGGSVPVNYYYKIDFTWYVWALSN